MSDRLISALSKMLPDADIYLVSERPWYSATFSGVQILIQASLAGKDRAANVVQFARELGDHKFDVPKYIVADIAVTQQFSDENRTHLTIDALLLDV